jgi:hypothetical protein
MSIQALSDISRGNQSAFAAGGGGGVHTGDTAPADPAATPIWITLAGRLYFWDGSVWFEPPGRPGVDGDDGREVEFQTSATHIQWRYAGATTWTDLLALAAITGADGADGVDAAPGGTDGAMQFNNSGALGGATNVRVEGGNLRLLAAADPAVPAAGGLQLYAGTYAGRLLPKMMGPAGIDTALQAGLHGNSVILISPTSGTTAPSIVGGVLTTAATMSLQYTAGSTNRWSSTQRKRFQTSTTAANTSGMRTAYVHVHRGSAAGFGGFFFRAQYGAQINLAGGQKFVGLCASTGALAAEPSALVNMCGVGYDSTDASTGNWFFMCNDGAGVATKVGLGAAAARGTTQGWDLIMFMAPGGSELFVKITNLNTGEVVLDTSYTTDLPAANTGLAFKAEVRNGAVAAADNLEVSKVYIETDY